MSVISISDFSSLNFRSDWKLSFQQNVDYTPKFLPSDRIQVEYISYDDTLTPFLLNGRTGVTTELTPEIIEENELYKYYLITIDNSEVCEDTNFSLSLKLGNGQLVAESDFCVCMELPGTVLLEYTNRRNIKDTIFHDIERFAFRIEGAFLPQENTFENESEDFRDQRYVPRILSSKVYETKTLTIGGGFGVPNWVARKINLIFSASSVHVDGTPMVRSEGSSVEINIIHNDYPLYLYKIVLEESEDVDDSKLPEYLRAIDQKKKIVRKISDDIFRTYDEIGALDGNAKMIRELELVNELSEYYTLEIDDNISGSTKKASLGTVIELIKTHFKENIINFGQGITVGDTDGEYARINEKGEIQSDNISSHDFTSGPLGSGHRIKDGNAEFQNVTVRGSISAFEYLIQQVKAVGGKLLVSGASMKVGAVEELEDGYKCSFNTDGGTIYNTFIAGDQAFHQVYNGQKKSRYWRLVTEIGSDYIVLSKTDCEAGSDVPQVGDEILQLGNRTDINRMSAIMLSAYDENSPYTAYYNGINSFSLVGKETMREGNLNGIVDKDFGQLSGFGMFADNVYLKGQFWLMSGKTVEQSIGEVQSNIDNLQIGTENLISWKMMLVWNKKNKDIAVYGQDADGVYLCVDCGLLYNNITINDLLRVEAFNISFKQNTQYVLSVEWKAVMDYNEKGIAFVITYSDGELGVLQIGPHQTTKIVQHVVSKPGKTIQKIFASYASQLQKTNIYNISLIEGNKPLQGFPVATDDLPNNINLVNGTKEVVLEDSGSTHNYKTLSIPVIKPNTAYYISFNTEFLAGSSEKFTTNIWDKTVENFLCYNNITTKQGGVIITKNDFTEQSGSLLIYAGIAGYTQGNSVKYTDIMLVEGRFPATAWTSSVNEQMNSIKTEVSAEIKAESDKINLSVSEKIANTRPGTVNYLNNSRFDNTSGWQNYDTIDIASDEYFGNVVQVSHSDASNYQKNMANDIGNINELKNTELVYFVIAKDMSGNADGHFAFGWYLSENEIVSETANKIDLGNGWFQYWTTFKSGNYLGAAIGLHDVKGTWRFFAAGILKGNLPTSWSPSLDDQDKYVDNKTYRVYEIDATSLDPNKYYPVTIRLNWEIVVRIEVYHVMNGVANPPWGTHESGFSLICKWTTNANGWGTIPISRNIEDFEYDWSSVLPVGDIGQLNKSSEEYIYVRGGTNYEFKIFTGGHEPILHTEPYTVFGDTLILTDGVLAPIPFKNETRASIEVLKDQINLKVSNNDIINQINLSTEGVRIEGSKIELDGTTIFKKGTETIQIFGAGDDVFSINNGVFRVDKNGVLTCTGAVMNSATVNGVITATTLNAVQGGKIGPFTISGSWLTGTYLGLSGSQLNFLRDGNRVYIGSHPDMSTGGGNKLGTFMLNGGSYGKLTTLNEAALICSAPNTSGKYALYVGSGLSFFKGIALTCRTSSSSIIIDRDNCIVVMTVSSKTDIYLPTNPESGQVIFVTEINNVDVGVLGNGGKKIFRNGTLYNWAQIRNNKSMLMLIYSGSYWIAHEYAGGTYSYGNN